MDNDYSLSEFKSSIIPFIEKATRNWANSIIAGRFDCYYSFKTNKTGMEKAMKILEEIEWHLMAITSEKLGLETPYEWKKAVKNREITGAIIKKSEDVYEICFELKSRKDIKKEGILTEQCECCKKEFDFGLKKCGGCKAVRYCSPECAKQDWKNGHKQACKITCEIEKKSQGGP